jgi:hypothetical protein
LKLNEVDVTDMFLRATFNGFTIRVEGPAARDKFVKEGGAPSDGIVY